MWPMIKIQALKDLEGLISPFYPSLISRVGQLIEDAEQKFVLYTDESEEFIDSFLWEHTLHVASFARKIALAEGTDALDAVIAALFHDSGKFLEGRYHDDDTPEEEAASDLARKILAEEGMDPAKIATITTAITALYNEQQPASKTTDVVHDADFLAKFGYLGVANFFVKSALRQKNLYNTLITSLSKEMTYASALKANMRTVTGKKMAGKKSAATLTYYRGLLDELREAGIAFFKIIEEAFPYPKNPDKILTLRMAVPESCPQCCSQLSLNFTSQTKIKCEKLTAKIHCAHCTNHYQISFCLPEIAQ
jgi:HD superfamily phosphodiesterase